MNIYVFLVVHSLKEAGHEAMIHEILLKKPLPAYATQGSDIFEQAPQLSLHGQLHPEIPMPRR
jgi:hypothetical protein